MKRSALESVLVGLLIAFALVFSTAVMSFDTYKLADGSTVAVWTMDEMDKLDRSLRELIQSRNEAIEAYKLLKRQCS